MRRIAPALVASILGIACTAASASRTEPLVQGTPSSDASVLAVIHTRPTGTRQLCTGTLVAPTLVLTAKHCVYEDMGGAAWEPIPTSDLSVAIGDSVASATDEIAVTSIATTAGPYHDGDGAIGGDLALLTLASAPAGLVPHAITLGAPAVSEAIRIVGFGYTEAGGAGTLGTRNEGSAGIVSVAAGTFTSEGASWTCTGDSGGPAFRASDGALIGVTSIGPRGCPASESIYTRLDAQRALLEAAGLVPAGEVDAGALPSDAGASSDAASPAPTPTRTTAGCGCRAQGVRASAIHLAALPPLVSVLAWRRRARRSRGAR